MKGVKMALSRKHYIKIAKIVKDSEIKQDTEYRSPILWQVSLISSLCSMFRNDNKLFNSNKFVEACRDDE